MSVSKVRKAFASEVMALVAGTEISIIISGGPFASSLNVPIAFPKLLPAPDILGRPAYSDTGTWDFETTLFYLEWLVISEVGRWSLYHLASGAQWVSASDVADPSDATNWTALGTETGTPVLTKGGAPLSLPVAWPNKKFVPPGNSPWLGFHWVPASRDAATLGSGGEDELLGFVQIDINVPQDSGEAVTESVLTTFENHFIAGFSVVNDSQVATVVSCSRSSGRTVNPYWRTSLTINFYSRITRPPINT